MAPASLSSGDRVRVLMTTWPDRPHSAFTGVYLGADEHGDWVGARAGTRCQRGGVTFAQRSDWVTLLPEDESWVAGFYEPALPVATYVDITTATVWDGPSVSCVDLDLDVVRGADGETYVDDEDEFARHRVDLGYPDDVAHRAEAACRWALDGVRREAAPFDGSHQPWLARLRDLVPA